MTFGEPCNPDAHFREICLDKPYHVDGVWKILDGFADGRHIGRFVSAQCEHIGDAVFTVVAEDSRDFVTRRADAGQVGNNGQTGLFLDSGHKVVRPFTRGASCTVGDADVGRVERNKRRDGFKESVPHWFIK